MSAAIHELPPIRLAELTERASLMTRTDRKYLIPARSAHRLLEALEADLRVLEIDGQRTFRYRSTYYDTPQLDAFRAAAGGRRRRFKVRRRDYVDVGTSFLEVKTVTGRGQSSKQRIELPAAAEADRPLAGSPRLFVDGALALAGVAVPDAPLLPQLGTEYERTTLLLESEGARLTIDAGLSWRDLRCGGALAARDVPVSELVDGAEDPGPAASTLGGMVVVETKAGTRPGGADRALWALGHRPLRLSKYATGLALLREGLAANRWHRTLGVVREGVAA